jgi:hypothetical protein
MIFRSRGRCEKILLVSRVARRSTPMTCNDRSKFSFCTLLFIFVLAATPIATLGDTLDDSARELARKIAAALPTGENVSCEIRNISSLRSDEAQRIEQALTADLQNNGVPTQTTGSAKVNIVVTLSENLKNFVWTAEIHRGDTSQVLLTTGPRPHENRAASSAMPITLHGEKFWEGPEQILDAFEETTVNDAGTLFLLLPDGLVIRKKGADSSFKIAIPMAQVARRTPFGSVHGENACRQLEFSPCVVVTLNGFICTVGLATHTVVECHGPVPLGARDPVDPLIFFPRTLPRGRSEPLTEMTSHCGAEIQFATGTGDYTQPDSVQAFDWRGPDYIPFSNELSFPGPVMALHVVGRVPTAIVRNLETGDYEAYHLSISCAQ